MSGKIDSKKIMERLKKGSEDRKKVSLYLSSDLFKKFKATCERNSVSASQVMEELMRDFTESVK